MAKTQRGPNDGPIQEVSKEPLEIKRDESIKEDEKCPNEILDLLESKEIDENV